MRLIGPLVLGISVMAVLSPACQADEKGSAILKEAFGKLGAAKTMSCGISIATTNPASGTAVQLKGTVAAMKPNFLKVEVSAQGLTQKYIADGKNYFTYFEFGDQKAYRKAPDAAKPSEYAGIWEGEIDGFFGGAANASKVEAKLTGSEKVGGVDCDIVKVEMKSPPRTAVYAIGKADKLIRRSTLTIPGPGGQSANQTSLMTDIKLNGAKTPAEFSFKPPAGARELPPPPTAPGII